MALPDIAVKTMFFLVAWRTIGTLIPSNTLVGQGLALGFLVICEAAIQSKLFTVDGLSEDRWHYVETEIHDDKNRRSGHGTSN